MSLGNGTEDRLVKGGSADQECVAEDRTGTGLLLTALHRISEREEDKIAIKTTSSGKLDDWGGKGGKKLVWVRGCLVAWRRYLGDLLACFFFPKGSRSMLLSMLYHVVAFQSSIVTILK